MKRYFLIDLENVGKHALTAKDKEQIRKISIEDVFIICHNKVNYSATSNRASCFNHYCIGYDDT